MREPRFGINPVSTPTCLASRFKSSPAAGVSVVVLGGGSFLCWFGLFFSVVFSFFFKRSPFCSLVGWMSVCEEGKEKLILIREFDQRFNRGTPKLPSDLLQTLL